MPIDVFGVDRTPAAALACRIAGMAHEGQTRRYTGKPYVMHPYTVARTVVRVIADVMAVTAAVLHECSRTPR